VHVLGDFLVDFLGALLAADALPKRGAIIEVIGNQRAVLPGFLDAFNHELRCGVTESGEDSAGVKPADPHFSEDLVPVEITGLELARGSVTTVGNPHGAAHAKAAFGEIEAVANDAADTVKRHPFDELDIDAALQDEILDQPAHVVVGEGGGNRGLEAETTAQSARDVVFAAAFPDFEFTGETD